MCGIGGGFAPDWAVGFPEIETVTLWEGLTTRGGHAHGFALSMEGSQAPLVMKWPGPSTDNCDLLQSLLELDAKHMGGVNYVLLHTRYATQGSVKENGNNHPITTNRMIVTHNGVLRNDNEIMKRLGTTRFLDVDTEAINASLRLKSPIWTINNITGSISVAWVDLDDTSTVHLMTNGLNPLAIGRLKSGHMVWASTEWHLADAFGDLLMEAFFALPFKQYSLCPDGAIRSKWISQQRAPPALTFNPWKRWEQ